MSFKFRFRAYLVLAALFVAAVVGSVASDLQAQTTYVWNTAGSGDWDTPGQWGPPGPVGPATGAGNTASFNTQDINGFVDVGMGTNRTIGHLIFGDTDNGVTTPGVWTLYDAANTDPNNPAPNVRTITLDGNGTTPTITVNQLGEVSPGVNDALIQDVSLAGTQGFIKNGPGVLTLTGPATTITGAVIINEGTLRLDSQSQPVTGAFFNFAGGGAQLISSYTLANNTTLDLQLESNTGFYSAVNAVNVAAASTATIITGTDNVFLSNVTGAGTGNGSILNVNLGDDGNTYSLDNAWTGFDAVNFTGLDAAGRSFVRARPNGGNFTNASFASTAVNLDNVIWVTRTNSFGNNIDFGALTGTSTGQISGGNAGGGSPPRYIVGALGTSTVFSGTLDGSGGMSFNKVGGGNLTLAGPITGTTWNIGGADPGRTGGVFRVSAGTVTLTGTTSIPGGAGANYTTIDVLPGAFLNVSGTPGTFSTSAVQQVFGSGTIVGSYLHDEGRIRPADTSFVDNDTNLTNQPVPTAGTINFNGNLTFSGGEIIYDMAATPAGANDKIMVTGTTSVAGGGLITPNFMAGNPAVGLTYTVLESTSGFSDSPAGWTVAWPGRGAKPTVVTNGNLLQFTTTPIGVGASMNWSGGGDPNGSNWDIETTQAWYNNDSPGADVFFQGDSVTFADTFSGGTPVSNSSVNLTAVVQPASVVVDSSSNDYTISGTGNISGSASFVKRGTSTLTMQINNGFSGGATIERGTVNIGGANGALGSGVLTMGAAGGGGTLITTAGDLTKSSLVIAGGDNTIRSDNGTAFELPPLSGNGNLTVTSNDDNLRLDINGVDPAFGGNVTFVAGDDGDPNTPPAMTVRISGTGSDFPNAAVTLANGATLANQNGSSTIVSLELGALTGDSTSRLQPFSGGGSAPGTNWVIGGLNAPTEFQGAIVDGGNGFPSGTALGHVTKVGSAELILSGANTYTGDTTVADGTLSITSPYLADGADVYLTTGATFDLDFGSLAIVDTIDSLFFDGISQATGTWGRPGSGADHVSSFFTGDGLLLVSTLQGIPGDFDMDNDVDGDDFLLWQRNPGVGNLADWEANYGTQALQAAQTVASTAVPEPTGGLLAAVGFALAGFAGRRRRSA